VGDYDGDRKADPAVYNLANAGSLPGCRRELSAGDAGGDVPGGGRDLPVGG